MTGGLPALHPAYPNPASEQTNRDTLVFALPRNLPILTAYPLCIQPSTAYSICSANPSHSAWASRGGPCPHPADHLHNSTRLGPCFRQGHVVGEEGSRRFRGARVIA